MKPVFGKSLGRLLVAAGVATLIGGVLAPVDEAAAQIANSKHDLSSTSTGGRAFSGTGEICVFCHTPHGAALGGAPLWNKTLSTGPYQVYDTGLSSTMDGQLATDGIAASPSVGSVSIGCLSCHDGTLAINSVINAPGSGLTTAAYTAGTWTPANPAGTMGAGIANLGQDLRNDHPIGNQYCGGGYTTAAAGSTAGAGDCVDRDFKAPLSSLIGGTRVFWAETGGNTTRSKTDLPLFNRAFAAGVGPSVECATCHDPHIGTGGGAVTFLRISNAGSALCLSCHTK